MVINISNPASRPETSTSRACEPPKQVKM
jgi:hypothetical protein